MNKLLLISFSAVAFSCGENKPMYDCSKDYYGMRVVDFGGLDGDYTLEKSCGEYINVDFPKADEKYHLGDTIGRPIKVEKFNLYMDNLYKQLNSIK